MWHLGLFSRVSNETKKINTNKLGPKNVPPNLIGIDEDKGKGGWTKGLADETRDRGKPLQPSKKGMREGIYGLRAKSDTTYQPFYGDGPHDPTCGRWGHSMATCATNWPTLQYCISAIECSNTPFLGGDATQLWAGPTGQRRARSSTRAFPTFTPYWIAWLDSAEWAKE